VNLFWKASTSQRSGSWLRINHRLASLPTTTHLLATTQDYTMTTSIQTINGVPCDNEGRSIASGLIRTWLEANGSDDGRSARALKRHLALHFAGTGVVDFMGLVVTLDATGELASFHPIEV
jgi:hypothetical protein